MNCKSCGHALDDGATRCPACGAEVELFEAGDPGRVPDALVTVLETQDATLVPVVRTLLEAEGIPVVVENEELLEMIGLVRFPADDNPIVPHAIIQVAAEDAEAARALIAHHMPDVQGEAVG